MRVQFPITFQTFLDTFITLFRFDVSGVAVHMELGCITTGNYLESLVINCMFVVIIVGLVVAQLYYKEWKAAREEVTDEQREAEARELFAQFDVDGDGIELEEIAKIVERIDPHVTAEEIQTIFDEADTDGSKVRRTPTCYFLEFCCAMDFAYQEIFCCCLLDNFHRLLSSTSFMQRFIINI